MTPAGDAGGWHPVGTGLVVTLISEQSHGRLGPLVVEQLLWLFGFPGTAVVSPCNTGTTIAAPGCATSLGVWAGGQPVPGAGGADAGGVKAPGVSAAAGLGPALLPSASTPLPPPCLACTLLLTIPFCPPGRAKE